MFCVYKWVDMLIVLILYFYPNGGPLQIKLCLKNDANGEKISCRKWLRAGWCFLVLSSSHLVKDWP